MNSVFAWDTIQIRCPVRLLHGMKDDVVPYMNSIKVSERLESDDVVVHLCKNSDHRMSQKCDLDMLADVIDKLLAT